MGGKGRSSPPPPAPIDPGRATGEYLFGSGFSSAQGITDPQLQERLIGAERTYRPQYTALELNDINVMAQGIEAGADNPEYGRLEAELAGLRAGEEVSGSRTKEDIEAAAAKLYPDSKSNRGGFSFGNNGVFNKSQAEKREAYISSIGDPGQDREARIAQIETQMKGMSPTLGGTPGLFDLLEEQSSRAGDLQREQLQLQREADVGALQQFAPQVVEAYRGADPYSTEIAESMSRKAMGQLTPEEQRGIDQRARQGSLARGRIGDSSSLAAEALGRSDYTTQFAQPAFSMNRQLAGDVGMAILGRPSAAVGLGGQMLGQARQGASGQMGPQLFDSNVGINMALQQRSQDINYQGAMAQANASRSSGLMGGLGSAFGGFLSR